MMPNYKNSSDEDLIELYYGCDDEAFAELEERYTRRLIGFFWKLKIRPRDDCLDCTQETWLHVARTKHTGKGRFVREKDRLFAPWLFKIAENVARDYWRRGKRRPQTVPPPQPDEGADDWDRLRPPDLRVFEDLYDCIERLDEPQRTVVLMRLAGFTLQEVGAVLGMVPSTVKTYEQRARQELKACLEGKGHAVVSGATGKSAEKAASSDVSSSGEEGD